MVHLLATVARSDRIRDVLPKKLADNGMPAYALFGDSLPFDMEAIELAARQIGTVRKQHAYLISRSLTATRTVGER
jgi:hypothetical protein